VVIRGAGKDFCAGADLDELLASADHSPAENEAAALTLGNVFIQMRKLPKPVVAVIHGRALAGGAGIVTGCDMALAQESARIGYPEIQRGFVPAMVMTMLRRAVGEKLAFDLAATGRVLTAGEAASAGLISRVFPEADFEAKVAEVVGGLAGAGGSAMALTKKQFYQLEGLEFEAGIRLGARVNALSRATPEFRHAISAFLKKE
jgi:methylglutaconyl-CoA hydratase